MFKPKRRYKSKIERAFGKIAIDMFIDSAEAENDRKLLSQYSQRHTPQTAKQITNNNFTQSPSSFFISQCKTTDGFNFFCPAPETMEWICDLGTGTSGSVAKMRHKPTGIVCAVKQMRLSGNDEENKRIYMDLKVVLQCQCDYIVRPYGYSIKDHEIWICMELMTTCFDKLLKDRRQPFSEKILGAVASSVLMALCYLKDNLQVIHRDIKPSNILINEEGQIKLCDFGISGRLVNSLARTRAAGCIWYMAPERVNPDYRDYDIRSDVWSLGVTLIELGTAEIPYFGLTDFSVISRIIYEEPPQLPDTFNEECRNFVALCLTKDYKDRPKYSQLLSHPFIVKHLNSHVKLDDLND